MALALTAGSDPYCLLDLKVPIKRLVVREYRLIRLPLATYTVSVVSLIAGATYGLNYVGVLLEIIYGEARGLALTVDERREPKPPSRA